MKSIYKLALALFAATPFLVGIDPPAWAQSRLTVNRDDPALVQFGQQPAAAAAGPTGAAPLEIPVLGLLPSPSAPAPAAPPLLVTDSGRDAGWYNLIYDRGAMKITINGDLSYQNLPAAAQLPSAPAEQYTVAGADDPAEPVAAQVVLYRFPNIPYVIDVYCKTAAVYEQCRSEPRLRALISNVGLLSAPQ